MVRERYNDFMPGPSSNASFIPKRGTTTNRNKKRGGRIYLLTIFSYVLIIAALIASAGVFFYERHVNEQLQAEISTMNNEINSFKQADLEKVQEFDQRLRRAQKRLEHNVSLTSIFGALEDATINTVQLSSLELTRNDDERIVLEADVETNNFDSSIFQRSIFEKSDIISEVEVDDVMIGSQAESEEGGSVSKTVSFKAYLSVPLESVPYVPSSVEEMEVSIDTTLEEVSDTASSSEESNSEESI